MSTFLETLIAVVVAAAFAPAPAPAAAPCGSRRASSRCAEDPEALGLARGRAERQDPFDLVDDADLVDAARIEQAVSDSALGWPQLEQLAEEVRQHRAARVRALRRRAVVLTVDLSAIQRAHPRDQRLDLTATITLAVGIDVLSSERSTPPAPPPVLELVRRERCLELARRALGPPASAPPEGGARAGEHAGVAARARGARALALGCPWTEGRG